MEHGEPRRRHGRSVPEGQGEPLLSWQIGETGTTEQSTSTDGGGKSGTTRSFEEDSKSVSTASKKQETEDDNESVASRGSTTYHEVFGLVSAEVASELGIGLGDFIVLILTRSEPAADLSGLVFVTMFEELCFLMVAAMGSGVAIKLIESIEAGKASSAASSRLGVIVSALLSLFVGIIVIIFVQPTIVRGAGLEPRAVAVVDAAVLPMCLALLPATVERVLGNMLSAMDAFVGLALTGVADAVVGVLLFMALQPSLGVGAYPWSTVGKSTVAVVVASVMVVWADSEEEEEEAGGEGKPAEEEGTIEAATGGTAGGDASCTGEGGDVTAGDGGAGGAGGEASLSADTGPVPAPGTPSSAQGAEAMPGAVGSPTRGRGLTSASSSGSEGSSSGAVEARLNSEGAEAGGRSGEVDQVGGEPPSAQDAAALPGSQDASHGGTAAATSSPAAAPFLPSTDPGSGVLIVSGGKGGKESDDDDDDDDDGSGDAEPRYTDIWIPCDPESWLEAWDTMLLMGLPSAAYVSVELLGHYFVVVVAGTIATGDVVSLRITEGFIWPAVIVMLSVLEAVAARAAAYLAVKQDDDATLLQSRARNLACSVALIMAVVAVLVPAEDLALPFYRECGAGDADCQQAVRTSKPLTVASLLVLAVDAVRISDQLLMRATMTTLEPLLIQTVATGLGMGISWWAAHHAGEFGMGTMGALFGRAIGSILCAVIMRSALNALLERRQKARSGAAADDSYRWFDWVPRCW